MATTALSTLAPAHSPAQQPVAPAPTAPAVSQQQQQQQNYQPSTNIVASQGPQGASQELSRADDASVSSASSPQFNKELTTSIPEESDEDSETVGSRNEPVTPVSGRQSSEFPAVRTRDNDTTLIPFPSIPPETSKPNLDLRRGPFASDYQFPSETVPAQPQHQQQRHRETLKPAPSLSKTVSSNPISPLTADSRASTEDSATTPNEDRRRSTRGSSSSTFKRTMSNLFSTTRKPNPQSDNVHPVMVSAQSYNGDPPERRWSMARSSGNTPHSTSPPSPSSSAGNGEHQEQDKNFLTTQEPPNEPLSKKNRASTGFSLRNRAVNFATGRASNKAAQRKRASSFDNGKKRPVVDHSMPGEPIHARQVLWMNAEQGVGVKARRLSLSLPDDFVIDVVELSKEFENQHKLFGRHRDNLGKGATARVRVMAKKGFPGELYAVKEFRGKASSETKEEYEKKVKSEYSIAKSLHHPNIVETVRLCIDHGRWDHVMEYCSEGDLFSLIKKGHLDGEDRQKDRLCLFKQMIQGLNYLHANGIAHRDVKLENLLLTKDSKLKITDFGVSEVFSGIHPGARESGGECGKQMGEIRLCNPGVCGSEPYIAPEVLAKEKKYDPRGLDVWGAGIVLIALMLGSALWPAARYGKPGCDQYTYLVKAFDKWNAKHPDGNAIITESDYPAYLVFDTFINPPALRRVLLMMLNPNPDKRSSLEQILSHRWVKNIECCQLESYEDPVVVIDATKKSSLNGKGAKKIFCHNHLPPQIQNTHSLGKMPGQAGY